MRIDWATIRGGHPAFFCAPTRSLSVRSFLSPRSKRPTWCFVSVRAARSPVRGSSRNEHDGFRLAGPRGGVYPGCQPGQVAEWQTRSTQNRVPKRCVGSSPTLATCGNARICEGLGPADCRSGPSPPGRVDTFPNQTGGASGLTRGRPGGSLTQRPRTLDLWSPSPDRACPRPGFGARKTH